MKPRCAPTPVRLRRGFTLVEIMVAVVILGLLILIAVPTYRRFQRKAQNTAFVNDLRIFTQVFETYAMRNGAWPPTTAAGTVPSAMVGTGEIREDTWTATTPVGGQWRWDNKPPAYPMGNLGRPTAAISVVGVTVDDTQMAEIDALVDNGDLSSGIFQKTADGQYSYVVQK